jgi:hypothetical protein
VREGKTGKGSVTKKGDPFDLEGLRIDPSDVVLVPSAERAARRKQQFIKVPLAWFDRFGVINSAATLKVALHLLQLHFRDRGRPARLGNLALRLSGVSRAKKRRALVELERLGLISVERRPRKSPIVTVILEREDGCS